MSFFGDPPPLPSMPARLPRSRTPEWAGPPVNVVPGAVGVSLVVGRTADTAVFVTGMAAYPTGVEFVVESVVRPGSVSRSAGFGSSSAGGSYGSSVTYGFSSPVPHFSYEPYGMPGQVPFGVKFADGSSARSWGSMAMSDPGAGPDEPRLVAQGGSSDDTRSSQRFWLWPLPPPGPVTFVTMNQERGLAESEVSIDADVVRQAAAQALVLWPTGPVLPAAGEPPADPAGASAQISAAYVRAFTGGQGDVDAVLAAVQGGEGLRPTVEQARQNFSDAVRTSRPTVGEIVFVDTGRAAVGFSLAYSGGLNFDEQIGYAVLVDGVWKVARETYCMVMGWAGAPCPPAA